jgi:hypothetical protein
MVLLLIILNLIFLYSSILFFIKKNKLEKKQIAYTNILDANQLELKKLKSENETMELELQFVKDIYRTKLLRIGMPKLEKEIV